jgi:CheY-like chemotaxis protein
VRKVAGALLRELGFSVLVVCSGEEALQEFQRHGSDISMVLLDMTMPGLSGVDTLKKLRELQPDVRAVLSTGYDEQSTAAELAGVRPVVFLKKPYSLADLSVALRAAASDAN